MCNSDLKTIEEYKRKAKELDIILDLLPGIVVYKDTKNNFIRVNKYLAEAQNMTKEEMEGKSCFDIYPPEEAQKYWDDDLEIIKSGKPKLNYEEPWESEEGSRWVSTNKIPYIDENGEAKGILAIAIDVTERKNAEEKLRKAQEQLNTILSNLKDTVFVISEDNEILFKNENAHSIFGDDLIGRNCYEVIKGGEQVCDNCPIQKLMTSDVCQIHSEHQILSPVSNEIKIFDVITTPIENYNGKKAYLEVLRDITVRKQLENENARKTAISEALKGIFQMAFTAETEEEIAKKCLEETQKLTRSKFGYIGEINQEGKFDTIALSNPGWEFCIIPKSEAVVLIQGMEIKGYWGKAITEGYSVIVNDPAVHPDAQGTPEGHPPITSFLGVPMKQANKVIGLIGIANKEEGYDLHDQEAVESLSVALVEALMRKRAEIELGKHRDQLDNLVQERVKELNCLKLLRKKIYIKKSLFERTPMAILLVNFDFIIEDCNTSAEDLFGYTREELLGGDSLKFDILPPDTKLKLAKSFSTYKKQKTKTPIQTEIQMHTKDGKIIWIKSFPIQVTIAEKPYILVMIQDITERRKAEQKLKESEEKYKSLFEQTPMVILLVNFDLIIEDCNTSAEVLFGYTREELLGVNSLYLDNIPPDTKIKLAKSFSKYLKTGVPEQAEVQMYTKDGKMIWIDSFPIQVTIAEKSYILVIIQDISERKKNEEELRNREKDLHIRNELSKIFLTTSGKEMYHKVLEFVKDLMQSEQGYFGYIDENGDLICPSLTFKIWDKCQVKDKDIIFPHESWTGLWGRSLLEKKILYSNKDLNVPEGHLHLNNSIVAPIIFKEKVIGQLGLANRTSNYTEDDKKGIEDITDFIAPVLNARIEHVKAEAREKRKTDTMNSINAIFQNALTYESVEELGKVCLEVAQELSGAKFGFFGEVNKEGKFDTIAISNPGWEECKMPGSEATKIIKVMEIRGMQFLPLKDGKSRIFKDPSNHPDSVGTPKGHPKITSLLAVPFKYKGKIIGQIGLGNKPGGFNHQDQEAIETLSVAMIEALMKKRVEENIKKSEENLRVSNESLVKAMKELKRSNIELEQFAYVASHDLQEPLRMVASFTQLLQNRYQDKLDDDANDFINYAVDGATRMQNLISDLLIFSRVGTRGKSFKATDMNAVLETIINVFRQSIKETSTEITYAPLPVVLADESQMIQLLQNLISNAIKFRGEETPSIHISGEVKEDKWIFSVSDNGIGMESKYFDRIFVIFQRLHKKDEYGGTGIGLAVCKKIIQRHNGKIWVESELGKGSTFYFSIPKKKKIR